MISPKRRYRLPIEIIRVQAVAARLPESLCNPSRTRKKINRCETHIEHLYTFTPKSRDILAAFCRLLSMRSIPTPAKQRIAGSTREQPATTALAGRRIRDMLLLMNRWFAATCAALWLGFSAGMARPSDAVLVPIENAEGKVVEAEVVSVLRVDRKESWLCFRLPEKERLYLYPFSSLSRQTVTRLSGLHGRGGILVADGMTGEQLGFLEEYLEAGPRERLVLELREARKKERLLSREWERLQKQTWQLQQQVARTRDPVHRQRVEDLFRQSLAARDRTGKQLSLCRADIRRMEERIVLLRRMGVEVEDNPFGGTVAED